MPEMNYCLVDTENDTGIDDGIMRPKDGSWPGNMALYIGCRIKSKMSAGILPA
jgi:hypothetical protein